jgi:mannose-1-phosphate guanylyltransferase
VVPTHPETGYGYIELAEPVGEEGEVYGVAGFTEKPDLETAAAWLMGGKHLWNGGVFVARADVALQAVAQHLPAVDEALAPLRDGDAGAFGSDAFDRELGERFVTCPSISIDYGIMEHRSDLRTVRLDAGWSDVGSWRSLLDQRPEGESNFSRGDVLAMDCSDSVLVGDGVTVTAVGLSKMAIVATGDAVLAVPIERSQDVRKVVDALQRMGRDELL